MSKRRDRKISKYNELVSKYLDGLEPSLKQIDEKFSTADSAKDPALKILWLQSAQGDISKASSELAEGVRQHSEYRARHFKTGRERWVMIATLPTFTSYPYTTTYDKSVARNTAELREQNPRLVELEQTLKAHDTRAAKMLDETIRYCNLNEISKSPWFTDAFNSANFLRQRFEAAAAAKKALSDEAPAVTEPAAEKPVVKKPAGGYDHLRNV